VAREGGTNWGKKGRGSGSVKGARKGKYKLRRPGGLKKRAQDDRYSVTSRRERTKQKQGEGGGGYT